MFTPRRVVAEELLDEHDAPRADVERSLRDLRRINRFCGGIDIYGRMLRRTRIDAKAVLDVGAGTCDNIESVTRVPLRVGVDFKIDHLLYLRDGSRVRRVVAEAGSLPFRAGSFDVVTSGHFFHHFEPDENVAILRESLRVSRGAVAVNDTRRHYLPLLFVQLISALRLVGRITRFDAPASVRRGYTVGEAEAVAARCGARVHRVVRMWPFRLGILLWK